ncbi:MAG: NRAMP family divalent metal transporter, partial [Bacillota bacterium]
MEKRKKLLLILSIIGPGLITVNAGNDAGGIATYATVGASYGYKMLWGLLLITFSLAIIQEMNARMAVVTGKGLADLIRENFGIKLSAFAMITLFIANFGVCVGDFAGVAASLELFGISKYISVPVTAVLVWLLVTKGTYSAAEKVFLAFTLVFFT